MSKSYHETYKDLKGKTKKEVDDMSLDPDSILHKLSEKKKAKKQALRKRENKKRIYNTLNSCSV